jgi:Ca-activated chloride channel family protein
MPMLSLAEPNWLALGLLGLLPLLAEAARPRLGWPGADGDARGSGTGRPSALPRTMGGRLAWLPSALAALAIVAGSVALARPRTVAGRTRVASEGIAIVVALDRSSSMTAVDDASGRGRLDQAVATLRRFVQGRPNDLIGLVAFANEPDLACPLTLDHSFLIASAEAITPARPEEDGTNLGDAVAWSLDALRAETKVKRKVIVLITDGAHDPASRVPPPMGPVEAARLAKSLGVSLHAIAVGHAGGVARSPEPMTGLGIPRAVDGPDVDLLQTMTDAGDGRLFLAADPAALDAAFEDLDRLERAPIEGEVRTRYTEHAPVLIAVAAGLISLAAALESTALRRVP